MSTGTVAKAVVTKESGQQLAIRPVNKGFHKVLKAKVIVAEIQYLFPGSVNG